MFSQIIIKGLRSHEEHSFGFIELLTFGDGDIAFELCNAILVNEPIVAGEGAALLID